MGILDAIASPFEKTPEQNREAVPASMAELAKLQNELNGVEQQLDGPAAENPIFREFAQQKQELLAQMIDQQLHALEVQANV